MIKHLILWRGWIRWTKKSIPTGSLSISILGWSQILVDVHRIIFNLWCSVRYWLPSDPGQQSLGWWLIPPPWPLLIIFMGTLERSERGFSWIFQTTEFLCFFLPWIFRAILLRAGHVWGHVLWHFGSVCGPFTALVLGAVGELWLCGCYLSFCVGMVVHPFSYGCIYTYM